MDIDQGGGDRGEPRQGRRARCAAGAPRLPAGLVLRRRPPLRGEREDLWRSAWPAGAGGEALRAAGIGIDDVAHLDLYSCFASSLHFAAAALGLAPG